MIILEGCDKVGKTSFGKFLETHYGAEYYHFGIPNPGENHIQSAIREIESRSANTVFDRCVLSGFAYDYNNTDPTRPITTLADVEHALRVAKNYHTLLIQVTCSLQDLKKRFHEEGDANDYVNERELIHVHQVYELLRPVVNATIMNIEYDTTRWRMDAFARKFDGMIKSFLH